MTLDEKTEQLRAKLDELGLVGIFIVSGKEDDQIATCSHNIDYKSALGFVGACRVMAMQLFRWETTRPKTTQDPSNNQEST